jgi:hypothetical protein
VMASGTPAAITTNSGDVAWRWIGPDEGGRELEVIAVEVQGAEDATPVLLVIHVMPDYQKGTPS